MRLNLSGPVLSTVCFHVGASRRSIDRRRHQMLRRRDRGGERRCPPAERSRRPRQRSATAALAPNRFPSTARTSSDPRRPWVRRCSRLARPRPRPATVGGPEKNRDEKRRLLSEIPTSDTANVSLRRKQGRTGRHSRCSNRAVGSGSVGVAGSAPTAHTSKAGWRLGSGSWGRSAADRVESGRIGLGSGLDEFLPRQAPVGR